MALTTFPVFSILARRNIRVSSSSVSSFIAARGIDMDISSKSNILCCMSFHSIMLLISSDVPMSIDIDIDIDSTTPPPPTKKEIVSVLTEPPHGMDPPTAQWLAMSYDEKSGDNFGFDNDLVTRLKPEFRDQDFHGLLRKVLAATETETNTETKTNTETNTNTETKNKNKTQVHVVRGGKNTGWSIPILSELEAVRREFPTNFHLHVLPSAGHNVHIDDLQGLVKLFDGR
mmetsp:Transcript_27881/g.65516  ORF Transcript_27881/g.65516 Transcript_27881/m.65516 type:complete len:230 (-) Transcript_27881:586-1275(-)